jgi:hypothetical protein
VGVTAGSREVPGRKSVTKDNDNNNNNNNICSIIPVGFLSHTEMCYQFTCTQQKAPDNSEVHRSTVGFPVITRDGTGSCHLSGV